MGRAMFENRTGYLYFIQADESGPIKVGLSKNPQSRLSNLQTANYQELSMLYFCPAGKETEDFVHYGLREERIRGEWFKPSRVHGTIAELRMFNARDGWKMEDADPVIDLVDMRLGSPWWAEYDASDRGIMSKIRIWNNLSDRTKASYDNKIQNWWK